MFSPHVWDAWRPRKKQLAVDWIPKNVWMPLIGEHTGRFDFNKAPHTRGVLEAWDDPDVREITLCWATRNMKTSTVISLMIFAAATSPCSMALGSSNKPSIERTMTEQLWPMLERCEATKPNLPPPHRRGGDSIELKNCRIRKAYGGSASSVAGYPAEIVGINEYSKWPLNKQGEGDNARAFAQRAKGFPYTSKVIKESSPGEKATCRVTADLNSPTTDRRTYHVPCPLCKRSQALEFGDRDTDYGIKWDKPKRGHSDPLKAAATAYYLCRHCHGKIHNEDRPMMMRRGLWLSEGQFLDKRGRIDGHRKIESGHIGFGPLSSLYSLIIKGWGQIVTEFLACGNDPVLLKVFQTNTLSLVWDPIPAKVDPHELGQRLCTPISAGICPEWTVFLTRGCDVQDHGNTIVWTVVAWGPRGQSAVIDWGTCASQEEYTNLHRSTLYRHADGGEHLPVTITLIDSGDGNVSDDIYRLCRSLHHCYPCKGSTHKIEKAFKPTDLHDEDGIPVRLIFVNSERSQGWIESHVRGYARSAPFNLPAEAQWDTAYLDQLLNEVKVEDTWTKTGVQDQRDAIRYAWCGAQMCTDDGAKFDNMQPRRTSPKTAIA